MRFSMMDRQEQSMLQQYVTSPVNLISTGACAQLNVGGGSFICLHTLLPEFVGGEIEKAA